MIIIIIINLENSFGSLSSKIFSSFIFIKIYCLREKDLEIIKIYI